MGAHLMVVHSWEEQVHAGKEWGLGPACCLPFLLRGSFVDMGGGAVATEMQRLRVEGTMQCFCFKEKFVISAL